MRLRRSGYLVSVSRSKSQTARRLVSLSPRDVDSILALCHPDIELFLRRSEIEGPYVGHAGVRRWAEETAEFDLEVRIDELQELDGRVVVLGAQWMGADERRALETPLVLVIDFDDELVRAVHAYPTRDDALRAAKLGRG